MTPIDLMRLDRLVAQLSGKLRAWRLSGRAGDPPELEREASSLATYQDLRDTKGDPIALRLVSHVAALTADRVTLADEVRLAAARRAPSTSEVAPNARVDRLARDLLDPSGDRLRRLSQLGSIAIASSDAQRLWVERRREAYRRLGLSDETEIEHAPLSPPGALALAEAALRATESAFAELRGRPLLAVLDRAIGAEAGEGWPARVTARWVSDVFGRGPLFDGLSFSLARLPDAVGAASFARALDGAGRELAARDLPPGVPFCVARDPYDLLEARRGALFASLVLEPKLHQKRLGLGSARAREQARAIARSSVVWVRIAALRALVADALAKGSAAEVFPELAERCLGRSLPRDLAGVFPLTGPRSALDLAAVFAAVRDRATYREAFDEDWFENPRAHEALRHEHHAARPSGRNEPSSLATEAEVDRALAEALA
ncbi:MAG: hypothetical protein JNL21_09375 [Myxococcales bacterium]|nr:hypothetical protein [Myxococcales bacterium]